MRIRILTRLFLNPEQQAYLRELSDEFNASSSQVCEELHNLSKAGLLIGKRAGRQILYKANKKHPLFPELQSMVRKSLGMDQILESILARLGKLQKAFLIDDYAEGKDSGIIDLVLVGDIEIHNLNDLVRKTEAYIKRKIRVLVLSCNEYRKIKHMLDKRPSLLLWQNISSKNISNQAG